MRRVNELGQEEVRHTPAAFRWSKRLANHWYSFSNNWSRDCRLIVVKALVTSSAVSMVVRDVSLAMLGLGSQQGIDSKNVQLNIQIWRKFERMVQAM